jgi:hypothetical protein
VLQLNNQSRFAPAVNLFADESGVDTLYVGVRGTFTLGAFPRLSDERLPPVAADVYWGEPGASSLKYASEIHVGKRGTDVALVGFAHAPGGRPVAEMLAALAVAGRRKVVKVVGDRTWRGVGGGTTRPEPFVAMPLVYERAFGGRDDGGRPDGGAGPGLAEERNPVGTGFRGRRSARESVGQRLPNLEDPRRPLTTFGEQPPPAAFGFVAPAWQPRRAFAGTYDAAWKRARAPFLPGDFDLRFSNAASAELIFGDFLQGGEPLALDGVSLEGPLRLSIPMARPRLEVWVAGVRERPPLRLETVLIEPDERRLSLTWRAALRCDKRALKIRSIGLWEEEKR